MSKARDLAGIFNLGPRSGTTAQRPSTAEVGDIFYNGTTGKTEIYTTTGWKEMASGIPFGNTAGRPAAVTGQPYFNGETQRLELFTGSNWENIVQEVPGVSSISGVYSEQTDSGVITIYGTNFVSGAYATAIGTNGVQINAASTTFNSLVQLTATFTGLSNANEPYDIKVTNPSNLFGLIPDALYINASPVWQTAAGSLGSFYEQVSVTLSALSATDSDSATITYALASGSSLPSGLSLNSSTGVISGTLPDISSDTTYSFTVNASDGLNIIPRSFSIGSLLLPAVEFLLVGGGGSGANGNGNSGGGGAGGVVLSSSYQLASRQLLVTVGAGGPKNSPANDLSGQQGSSSYIGSIVALGGGGGLGWGGNRSPINGGNGGGGGQSSTGGSSSQSSQNSGITGITQYGNAGGNSGAWPTFGGAGGGGAGAAGGNSASGTNGSGGAGISSSITGTATYYAGGGGGGAENSAGPATAGTGGLGGGGDGRSANQGTLAGGDGTDGLGGGGGNGGWISATGGMPGGKGGSGVVIIAYPNTYPAITTIPGTLTYDQPTRSGYRVYRFTAGTGTITI